MRPILTFLVLPLILTLTQLAAAQAQTLQMKTIHGVAPGMSLEDGISILEDAGFVFGTLPDGEIDFEEQRSDTYEGNPVFMRFATGELASENVAAHLIAVRKPDAPEDDFRIAVINRGQSFHGAELKPRYDDLLSQAANRIGAEEASCTSQTGSKARVVYFFDDENALIPGNDDFCQALDEIIPEGEFGKAVLIEARANSDDKKRVNDIEIGLMDGALARLATDIRTGIYGKTAPALGDF